MQSLDHPVCKRETAFDRFVIKIVIRKIVKINDHNFACRRTFAHQQRIHCAAGCTDENAARDQPLLIRFFIFCGCRLLCKFLPFFLRKPAAYHRRKVGDYGRIGIILTHFIQRPDTVIGTDTAVAKFSKIAHKIVRKLDMHLLLKFAYLFYCGRRVEQIGYCAVTVFTAAAHRIFFRKRTYLCDQVHISFLLVNFRMICVIPKQHLLLVCIFFPRHINKASTKQ